MDSSRTYTPTFDQHAPGLVTGYVEHVSPRRGIKRTDNVSDVIRKADRELRDRWGCKHYVACKRCPKCGTKNLRRRQDGTCLACSMKEVPPCPS